MHAACAVQFLDIWPSLVHSCKAGTEVPAPVRPYAPEANQGGKAQAQCVRDKQTAQETLGHDQAACRGMSASRLQTAVALVLGQLRPPAHRHDAHAERARDVRALLPNVAVPDHAQRFVPVRLGSPHASAASCRCLDMASMSSNMSSQPDMEGIPA
jgi:hypothetical protein